MQITNSNVHYNRKLFEILDSKHPSMVYTMGQDYFCGYGELLQFAYLLSKNKNVHNLVINFINHHAMPSYICASDIYVKSYNAQADIKDYATLRNEWEDLDYPPIHITFSLDEDNKNQVDFVDNKIFRVSDPNNPSYYYGYTIGCYFEPSKQEKLDKILKDDIIEHEFYSIIFEEDIINTGTTYYA